MEKEVLSYGFFHTLKVSIFQFDKYHEIIQQRTRKMLLFLFEIVVLVALIITGAVVLRLNNTYDYAYNFAKDNLPNFTITKEGFHMDIEEPLIYKNTEYFNSVVVFDNNTENKKYLDEANQNSAIYLIFTKNSLVFKIPGTLTTEYKFADMFPDKKQSTNTVNTAENAAENVAENVTENTVANETAENKEQKIDKEYILKVFDAETMRTTIGKLAIYLFLLLFLSLVIISLINIFALAVLGYVFAKIIKMPFKFGNVFNMAIAATALPSILLCVYMVINILTGFTIAKFDILYALVSYIYLGAAILILRSNMNKTKVEKEKKVAADTGSANVEITIDDAEEKSEEDDSDEEDKEDSEEEK